MNKEALKLAIITFFVVNILTYLLVAFMELDLNILNWSDFGRAFSGTAGLVGGPILAIGTYVYNDSD